MNPTKRAPSKALSPAFIRKLSSWLVLSTALTLGASYAASIYHWDPDTITANNNLATQAGLGGTGTWDTVTPQWWDGVTPDRPWNNAGFDIAVFGGLNGGVVTTGAPIVAGGLIFNTGGYSTVLTPTNTLTLQSAPTDPRPFVTANANASIGTQGVSGIVGTQGLEKRGGGTLTVLGNNLGFTGTTTLRNGTLTVSGGSDTTPDGTKSLGNAQPIVLEGGILRYANDSGIAQYNNDITLNGNATITVDRAGTSTSGGVIELNNLTIGSNTLTTTNGNTYGLRFLGTTLLQSAISTINATFNPAAGVFNAAGATTLGSLVTGPGALNKTGAGTLFVYNSNGGPDNNYTGGTNVLAGTLALGDSFAQFGSGRVIVNPGTVLRVEDNLNFLSLETSGARLLLQSSSNALSVLALDADFTPNSPALSSAQISPFGAVVEINSPTTQFFNDFNFANIGSTGAGNGKVFLGALVNTTLIGFSGQITAGSDNQYRLGANSAAGVTLTLSIPNILNGGAAASLAVGVPIQNLQNITNGTGTVSIIEAQNYGGLTTINSGSTLSTGGNPSGNPLGTGTTINDFGTLNLTGGDFNQLAQTTFNVYQARGTNGALILNVTSFDFAGTGSTNERLKPAAVLNYSGGTLTFTGYTSGNATEATPLVSSQTIGTFNASGANLVNVTTSAATTENLDAVLTFTNLNRQNNGTVAFAHSGATQPAFGSPSIGNGPGIPANLQNSSDIRVFINNLQVNGVGTGAPVVTNGMIAPYLIDVTNLPLGALGDTVNGSTSIAVASAIGLSPGMILTGNNIPLGASVVTVNNATTLTNGQTANGNATVTVASTAGLAPGMRVSGLNIPSGATISSITNGTMFVLSAPATGTATNVTFTTSALFTISRAATASATGQTFTANAQQFLSYNASTGITAAPFSIQATTAAQLQAATAVDRVTVDNAITMTADVSVQALRLGDNVLGGTNTITIGSQALATQGAGLILNQTSAARTHTPNFTFGTGGNREAIIYVTGGQTATLSGVIAANGLTKFGASTLFLTGANPNLIGTITINQGILDGSPVAFNFRPITLNAGNLGYDGSGSAAYLNDVTVTGDATISAGDVEVPRIGSLTINARATGSTDPIVLTITQGLSVTGNTTLLGNVHWVQTRGDRNSDVRARVLLSGIVTGPGSFTKWSGTTSGTTAFLNRGNNYTGPTTINGGTLESLTGVGTPFGTGAITVNPGGVLRIVNSTNIIGNALTVNSDLAGLGVISLAYNGNVPLNGGLGAITFNNGNLGGPFSTVLAVDAVGYSGAINLTTFAGGTAFLGTALGGNFTGVLTASTVNNRIPDLNGGAPVTFSGGVYRLGGGGSGFLNLAGGPNQLTGSTVLQIGAISNVTQGASVMLLNGNQNTNLQGAVQLVDAHPNLSGLTILNGGFTAVGLLQPATLSLGHDGALGTSKIVFNGGALQADTTRGLVTLTARRTIGNAVGFTGDAVFNGSTDLVLSANFGLADNQIGATRTFTVNNTAGLTILSGDISNGAGTASLSSITKAGAGPLIFTGNNTYSGFTNLLAGTVVISNDSSISPNSQINFTGGNLGIWNSSFTTNRNYTMAANAFFDVGVGQTFTQSIQSNFSGPGQLIKTGLGAMVLEGVNSGLSTSGNQWFIDNGTLVVRAAVNFGDPTGTGAILLRGGGLRAVSSFSVDREINNDANVSRSGFVDVTGANVFTTTRQIDSVGTADLTVFKAGSGTFENNAYNTLGNLILRGGTFSSSSNAPLSPGTTPLVADTTGTTSLVNLAPGAINRLFVGVPVSGPGIAANTRITAINYLTNSVTLSIAATASATGVTVFSGDNSILGLHAGTFLLNDTPATSVTGTSTVSTDNSLVTVPTTAGLLIGQSVTGPNIPAGTTIQAIRDTNTFLLSQTPTATNPTPVTFTLGQASQSVVVGTAAIGGGGHLALRATPGFSTQLNAVSLSRVGAGTLVIDPGTSTLGGAGDTNAVRFIPTNFLFAANRAATTTAGTNVTSTTVTVASTADLFVGMTVNGATLTIGATGTIPNFPPTSNITITAINSPTSITIGAPTAFTIAAGTAFLNFAGVNPRANSLNNGIFPASIVTADSAGVASFTTNNAATGIVPFTGYTAIGAGPTNVNSPTLVGNVGAAGTVFSGTNSLYALRTSGNLTGGTLKIGSVNNTQQGGIIVNASATIGTNLVFDPTTSDATKIGVTSGEGLFYVARNATATLTGNVTANGFTKFGEGTAVFAGPSNGIFGALTIQEGTVRLAPGAQLVRLQTDLVANGEGTLDLAGNNSRFNALYNTGGFGGGIVTNNGGSDAALTIFATTATVAVPTSRAGLIGQNNRIITGLASTADLQVGMTVSGTNIAGGAYILTIDSPTQITISSPGLNVNTTPSVQTVNFGSSLFAGRILDGATNKVSFVKNGTGIVILGGFSVAAPRAGDNTFSGGTVVNQGTLQIHSPQALGGADGTTPGAVVLFGGTLDLRNDGAGVNGTIVLGNPASNGVNVNLAGPATINVDRLGSLNLGANQIPNTGNKWQINNLVLSENTLSISGANSYGLRVAGTTTIAGTFATINSLSDQANGNLEFAGQITGPGAFNKTGTALQRTATITNPNNTYTGGTNVISGSLQVTATTGTPLGTGRVNVFPNAMLRIAGLDPAWQPGAFSSVAGQAQLKVHGYFNSLGIVGLDNSFNPSSLLNAASFGNAYGSTGVALSTPFFSQALDMSTIGDGRAFLISGITSEVGYAAPNLAPGLGNGTAPRTYRLAGGINNLAFIGADNVLNDLSAAGTSLQVGSLNSLVATGAAITGTGNNVIIRNSNSFTGGTWIGKGSGVILGVGSSPVGSTPLGSANGTLTGAPTNVIIYGSLSLESRLESSFFNAAADRNANNYILRPGGQINLTDFAGETPGGNDRWADTDAKGGALNLNGGSFQFNGAGRIASSEVVGTFTVDKNSRILINRPIVLDSGTATLIVNDLVRANRGTLLIQPLAAGATTANILGIPVLATDESQGAAGHVRLIVNNASSAATILGGNTVIGTGVKPATATAGVAPGWIVDVSTNSFVTYNPTIGNTGYQPLVTGGSAGADVVGPDGTFTPGPNQVGYSKVITTTGAIPGTVTLAAADTVDINTTAAVTLTGPNTRIYALRTNQGVNPTAANNTLTISSGALITQTTASIVFNGAPAPANGVPQPFTLNFGVGGVAEAVIFTSNTTTTINGQINAAGLTHFAPAGSGSNLVLTGSNNLTAAVRNNQGILQAQNTLSGIGTPVMGVFNNQNVFLGGSINRDASRLILDARVGNATTSVLASGVQATSQFGGTIFVDGESRIDTNGAAFSQRINNLTFADLGQTSPVALSLAATYVSGTTTLGARSYFDAFFSGTAGSVLGGLVQGGTLEKFGNGTLLFAGTANTYAGTVINQSTPLTATSILGSLTRTGTPFGSGPITINPGGMLRLADASNIAANVVSLRSDGVSLGGLAVAYNSTAPISSLFGAGAGKVNISSTGDFRAAIALDINNYINPINMAALETAAGGKLWLGTSITANYFNQTLTPGTDNVYRLGGGGNQGNLIIGAGSFENVLTGNATVQIGALTAGLNPNGPAYVNGNIGQVTLTNRNNVTGDVSVNLGSQLTFNNSYGLGGNGTTLANGTVFPTLLANGGNFVLNNSVSIPNPINAIGGGFGSAGGNNGAFTGAVRLADGDVGGTVTLTMAGTGVIGFQGVISGASAAGTPGSNVIKGGIQTVVFNGINTYLGTTSVTAGFLGIGTDVSPNTNGALGNNDVPVILSTTSGAGLLLAGQVIVDRGLIATVANTALRGQSLNRSTFSGGIAITAGTLIIDQVSTNNATFRGGVLDVQGAISGVGAIQIGNTNVQGSVRLSSNSNGFSTNTFTGGLTLQAGRLQVNGDTYYTGPANNPTIISGPLGTGTLTFGAGNTNAGGEIVAFGADRVILNALGALSTAADTTTTFGGHNNLTFTRDLDLNSNTTLRNRIFNVLGSQGVTTFSGDLSSSGTLGGRLTKSGAGTLVLSGNNTFFGAAGTDLITVSAGVLEFTRDANLGAISTTQSDVALAPNTTLLLRGTTPVTWSTAGSNRNLLLTGNLATVDVRDVGGLFTINTQVTGAFSLNKQGSGTLMLNATNNAFNSLIIGGPPAAAAANLPSGTTGGIVSTTATSGTPFSNSVVINDGRLNLVGGPVAQNLTIASVSFAGGSSIGLSAGATTTRLLASTLARVNQGTLVIIPTAIANLGGSEQLDSNTTFTTVNGMLATPTVVVRDAATGNLNYVKDGAGTAGFSLHSATTTASLAASAATSLADLTASTVVGAGPIDIYAVRTSANITPGDPTSLLRILNGGLIFNGTSAPNLSANAYFGNGTTPLEAFVYTAGGLSGASNAVISGSFTAANFTKSGLGDLLISGTNNVMAGTSTVLRTLQINDGTVRFAGQASLPSNGLIVISPMDGAALDLNGQNLTLAALGGSTAATAATGRVINTGAAATLTLASRTGITSNFNGLISGNVSLVKDGIGTVILGYNNEYTGGTTIGVGNITSASGVFTGLGTLQVNSFNSLGSGPVNFAGGILDIRNPIAPNEVQDNIDIIAFGPENGYDMVVRGLNNLGAANTTSGINTTSTLGFQAINSLTFESNAAGLYAFSTGGASANGLLVRGATTLAGNTTLNIGQQAVFAGKVAAASGPAPEIIKIGASTLFLTNTERDTGANAVSRWNVFAGNLEVRMSQGGSNPLTNGATVQLNTAGSLNIRHDGDNLTDPQVLTDFATNNLQVGSLETVSSGNFLSSLNPILSLGSNSTAINKTVQFNQVRFGGALGTSFLFSTLTAANGYNAQFVNGLTMIKDAYLSPALNGASFGNITISGQLSGNGTLFKQGTGELDIDTVATNTGGTVLAGGDTFFGSFQGQTRTLSTTAKLSAGNITIQPGARLRFNAISNLNGGQLVDVLSNLNSLGLVGIGDNTSIASYNIRAPFASGVFSSNAFTNPNSGAGILALNALYDATNINMSRIGDGTWFLGSTGNGSGLNLAASLDGRYTAAQLLPGAVFSGIGNNNPTYRLGGGAGTLYIGLAQPGSAGNQLFGSTNVVVGAALTSGSASTVGNGATAVSASGSAGVIFNQAQSYTGTTLVNRGSQLEFRGGMSTAGYDVFGTLVAGGTNGTFVGQPNPVLRPGSQINLDNQFDLMPVAATQGRWGDATPVNLDGSTFRVIGNSAADLREVVGAVNVAGQSFLTPQRTFTGRIMEINVASLNRRTNQNGITGNNGSLSIEPTTAGQLGTDERVTIAGGIAAVPGGVSPNGMVAPWMFSSRDSQFVTYSDFGFVNAGFDLLRSTATATAQTGTGTERLLVNTGTFTTGTNTVDVFALRADTSITGTGLITIRSGGYISAGSPTISAPVSFNPSGAFGMAGEAILTQTTGTTIFSGAITAPNGTSKNGDGTVRFNDVAFDSNVALNRGTLVLSTAVNGAGAAATVGGSGTIAINGANALVQFISGGVATFSNSIYLAPGNPLAQINNNNQNNTLAGGLTFGGAPGDQGQTLTVTGGNTFQVNGITNLGPAGNAVFNMAGSNLNLAGVVQGSATLVKEGGNTLALLGDNSVPSGGVQVVPTAGNTFTGGIVLVAGTLQANVSVAAFPGAGGTSPVTINTLGTNAVTLVGGTLNVRTDLTNSTTITETATLSNNLTVVGNATVTSQAVTTSGGSNKTIAFNSLAIGGQTLTINQGNTFRTQFNAVSLTGAPTFVLNADTIINGRMTDNGAGLGVIKTGGNTLWFADATSDFTGGLFINNGVLRFGQGGGANLTSTTAQAGRGNITINPNGQIILESIGNIAAGQRVDVRSVPQTLGIFRTQSVLSQAQVTSILTNTSTGLFVAGVAYTQALDLAAIGDGTFQFANAGDFTYSAATLGAGAGNVYRLGGNNQNFRITAGNANVLTDVTTPIAGRTVAGPTRLQIGSLGSAGGNFVFNNTNNYTGGTVIVRGATAQWSTSNNAGGTNTPLGTGPLDVFGTAQAVGAGGVGTGGLFNQGGNITTIHPGANITIDNSAGNIPNRWGGGNMNLDGATFQFRGGGTGSSETFSNFTFGRGARINTTPTTIATTITTSGNFTRENRGSLVFQPSAGNLLGAAAGIAQQFIVSTPAQRPAEANGMAPAYFVDGTSNQFVTYGANGFTDVPYTAAAANLPAGLTAGTAIVQVTGAVTLADNPVIYALGVTSAATINNGVGQFNTITLDGANATASTFGGLLVGNVAVTINANLRAGPVGQFELPIFINGSTTQLSGDISATGITKFGAGVLQINQDQTDLARGLGAGYSNGWVVNEGSLTANVFGALGNAAAANTVVLNGSAAGAATLLLRAAAVPTNSIYTSGKITAVDNAVIDWTTAVTDVVNTIADVEVASTGGSLLDAQLRVNIGNTRAMLQAGQLSITGAAAGALVNVIASASGNGIGVTNGVSSGFSVASLMGAADTRLNKWGQGILYVRGDSSASFSGSVNVEQGAIQIDHPNALGTGLVTVKRYGVLDINTTGYTGAPVYLAGGVERWTSDGARSGAVNLGGGSLQVANDQTTTTAVITLNGGTIEGYLRFDDTLRLTNANQGAVYRTLGSGVSFVLAGNSFLGQPITEGINGLDSGVQPNIFQPFGSAAAGVILDIKGNISGIGSLTKQGHDSVTLSGNNSYSGGTNVLMGTLRVGRNDALPTTGALSTTGGGVFDLNGFNQQVSRLTSPAAGTAPTPAGGLTPTTTNAAGSGYITNSSTELKTLTVGTAAGNNAVYGGVIQYNVAVTKAGTNVQTLTNANTYVGPTTISGGALEVSGSLAGTTNVDINTGGTLSGAAALTSPLTTALVAGPLNLNGGTFSPGVAGADAATAGVNSVGTFNAAGGFNTTGGGTLRLDLQTGAAAGTPDGPSRINDRINVTGAISLAGTTAIQLTLTGSVNVGDLFFIALNDGIDPIIGSTANFTITPGFTLSTTGNSATGAFSGGNDIAIMAVVPEPSALSFLAVGLSLGLGLQRFRCRWTA